MLDEDRGAALGRGRGPLSGQVQRQCAREAQEDDRHRQQGGRRQTLDDGGCPPVTRSCHEIGFEPANEIGAGLRPPAAENVLDLVGHGDVVFIRTGGIVPDNGSLGRPAGARRLTDCRSSWARAGLGASRFRRRRDVNTEATG
jgi:hypothetical protein